MRSFKVYIFELGGKPLYYTKIHSRLHYCILVRGTMAKGNRERIHVLQKRFLRFIEKLLQGERTSPFFQKHKILKNEHIYIHRLALQIYDDLKFDAALFLSAYKRPECNYKFRQDPYIKKVRTFYGTQSLDYCIPDFLNKCPEIPEMAREAKTIATFKKRVKTLLLSL